MPISIYTFVAVRSIWPANNHNFAQLVVDWPVTDPLSPDWWTADHLTISRPAIGADWPKCGARATQSLPSLCAMSAIRISARWISGRTAEDTDGTRQKTTQNIRVRREKYWITAGDTDGTRQKTTQNTRGRHEKYWITAEEQAGLVRKRHKTLGYGTTNTQ